MVRGKNGDDDGDRKSHRRPPLAEGMGDTYRWEAVRFGSWYSGYGVAPDLSPGTGAGAARWYLAEIGDRKLEIKVQISHSESKRESSALKIQQKTNRECGKEMTNADTGHRSKSIFLNQAHAPGIMSERTAR